MTCPTCSSALTEVIETRLCSNGTRRRRRRCRTCGYRWTTWEGERPPTGAQPGVTRAKPPRTGTGRLTTEQVRFALARTDLNNRQAGREIGCSAEAVRQIRNGTIYAHVLPQLPRPGAPSRPVVADGPSCLECVHWDGGGCGFGFPDPLMEGVTFAADCDLYERVSQSMSRA